MLTADKQTPVLLHSKAPGCTGTEHLTISYVVSYMRTSGVAKASTYDMLCHYNMYVKSRQALRHDNTEFRLQDPPEHRQHLLSASASARNHNSKSI